MDNSTTSRKIHLFSSVPFHKEPGLPLYQQIANSITKAISSSQVASGMKLPSIRNLAQELQVNPDTVKRAYRQLVEEGFIVSKKGSGFSVADTRFSIFHFKHAPSSATPLNSSMELGSKALLAKQVAAGSSQTLFLQNKPLAPYISNMGASPERKYLIEAARLARSPWLHSFYTDPQGYLPLRKVICENLFLSRGISCSPEQIVITCGTVQSLNLCAKLLFEEKDFIWQEAPGHVLFNTLFEFNGIRNVSVKVDDEGFSVEEGLKLNPDAKGVLVFPPSQYPMSVQMSGRRRKALLEYALSKNLWILELDTDRTPSLDNSALLPIRSMKGAESCVIYLESFSSLLYPGIKVGYMVVPSQAVQAFTGGKLLMDRNVSEVNQVLVERFLSSKEYESYIRRLTRLYRNRYAFIRKVVKEELNDFCYLNDTKSGPHLALILNHRFSDITVHEKLKAAGVEAKPLSAFQGATTENGLLIGYGTYSENQILQSLMTLKKILEASL